MSAIDNENGVEYIEAVVRYTLTAGEISDPEEYIKSLREGLSKETGERIMTGAEQLIEIGEKRGIQQGKLEGERIVLKRQIELRFGEISETHIKKINNADSEALLLWLETILDAENLDDVFVTRH